MVTDSSKVVLVLGGAYAGARAAQVLAAGVPDGWKVILVDRNTHVNHAYILPRLAVLPGHEHKAFIPFTNVFMQKDSNHLFLNASVVSVDKDHVVLSRPFPEHGYPTSTVPFDFMVYALGSRLPAPLNLWDTVPSDIRMLPTSDTGESYSRYTGTKAQGITWLQQYQDLVREASSVLVVGGGALGVQFATDIAAIYPDKRVSLVHSRHKLLPRFEEELHLEILKALELANIEVILGERLDMKSIHGTVKLNSSGQRVVRMCKGREVAADVILLCTGQTPNTAFLRDMDPRTINPEHGLAYVLPTMQLNICPAGQHQETELSASIGELSIDEKSWMLEEEASDELIPYPNIFVVGDAADAFGALQAGHNAYYQAQVAARNILKLIQQFNPHPINPTEKISEELEHYTPGAPAIKVSLGLTKSVYQVNGAVGVTADGKDDLDAAAIWPFFGAQVDNENDMYR